MALEWNRRSRKLRLTTVGNPPRWPRDTPLSAEVGTKFRRQVAVAQSVYFACGLRATEFFVCWVEPSPRLLRPLIGLFSYTSMIDDDGCAAISGINEWEGKRKYSEYTCCSAALSTTDPTWLEPGSNPGRSGRKPGPNRLIYGKEINAYSRMFLNKELEVWNIG
jgi:hypothetical protein